MVELLAEAQVCRAALVETCGHHRATQSGRGQRALQAPVGSGHLDGHVHAVAAVQVADGQPDSLSSAASSTCVAPKSRGQLAPVRLGVDPDDVLDAFQPAHLHGQQPDRAEAVHAHRVAELDLRVVHRLQRDGGQADEQRPLEPLVGGQDDERVGRLQGRGQVEHRLLLVRSAGVDEVPHRHLGHARGPPRRPR